MRDRVRPSADAAPNDNPAIRHKPIILRTGRGDSRITPAEARSLAVELLAAAEATDPTAPTEAKA